MSDERKYALLSAAAVIYAKGDLTAEDAVWKAKLLLSKLEVESEVVA